MTTAEVLTGTVGLLLCAALAAVLLRGQRPEMALCVSLAAGLAVTGVVLSQLAPLITTWRRLLQAGGFSEEWLSVVLRAAGVCLVTQLAADTCRDAGETALAGKAELVGRVLLLLLAVPLFEQILSLVTGLLNRQAVGG